MNLCVHQLSDRQTPPDMSGNESVPDVAFCLSAESKHERFATARMNQGC